MRTGYFSIIQYCPCRLAAEVANVGVMVWDSRDEVHVRVNPDLARVHRIFPQTVPHSEFIFHMIGGVAEGLRRVSPGKHSVEEFIGRLANDVIMTPLRFCKYENVNDELNELFDRCVAE